MSVEYSYDFPSTFAAMIEHNGVLYVALEDGLYALRGECLVPIKVADSDEDEEDSE